MTQKEATREKCNEGSKDKKTKRRKEEIAANSGQADQEDVGKGCGRWKGWEILPTRSARLMLYIVSRLRSVAFAFLIGALTRQGLEHYIPISE